jgi:hypothetical protein
MRAPAPARCPADLTDLTDPTDLSPERRLLAAESTPGRALPAGAPALGAAGMSGHPVLLLEPAEAFIVVDPSSGRDCEMQAEILVRQGFHRLGPAAPEPGRLAGWSVRQAGSQLQVRDGAGELWAYTSERPNAGWLAEAERLDGVLVVYGALVGVRAPRGVAAGQYGPRQRAAELSAGRSRGFVAAAVLAWPSTRSSPG